MRNIVIIGNGFDLAHGLDTKYDHFVNDIKTNPEKYGISNLSSVSNYFLHMVINLQKTLWSDIEYLYYDVLTNLNNSTYFENKYEYIPYYETAIDLNRDFKTLTDWLCLYLEHEEKRFEFVENYQSIFEMLNGKQSVVLNFNYTNTVRKYLDNFDNDLELIHIHGELNNEFNPIIFGYAAGNEESKKLLIENDNNYVRNIKKFNYLFTRNEEILKNHLKSEEYNVFILGHSCGVSDKLILNQIFNSKGVNKIYSFYHQDKNGYFETLVNIDRIIDDYSKSESEIKVSEKFESFPNSYKMPQKEVDKDLIKFLTNILDSNLPKEEERQKQRKKMGSIASAIR